MKLLRRLFWIALFAGAVYVVQRFSNANAGPVRVDLLIVEVGEVALWIALLVAFAVGAAMALLFSMFELAKQGLVARRYRKKVEALDAEVHQLRTLPLSERAPEAPVAAPAQAMTGSVEPVGEGPRSA